MHLYVKKYTDNAQELQTVSQSSTASFDDNVFVIVVVALDFILGTLSAVQLCLLYV